MKRKNDMNLWWGVWWIAVAIFFLGAVCCLPGCGAKAEAKERNERFEIAFRQDTSSYSGIYVFRDGETGREYLYCKMGNSGGLTLMPEHVEEETFTGETEPMVFNSALPTETVAENATVTEEPVAEAYDKVTDEPMLESLGMFRITAYCSCEKCCGKTSDDPWYGITATGTKATEGRTIAVDPKVISYGSVVYFEGIDGFGGYVAEDCGGAIKGNDIDLYFDSHEEALEWGVRELEVFCMEEMK